MSDALGLSPADKPRRPSAKASVGSHSERYSHKRSLFATQVVHTTERYGAGTSSRSGSERAMKSSSSASSARSTPRAAAGSGPLPPPPQRLGGPSQAPEGFVPPLRLDGVQSSSAAASRRPSSASASSASRGRGVRQAAATVPKKLPRASTLYKAVAAAASSSVYDKAGAEGASELPKKPLPARFQQQKNRESYHEQSGTPTPRLSATTLRTSAARTSSGRNSTQARTMGNLGNFMSSRASANMANVARTLAAQARSIRDSTLHPFPSRSSLGRAVGYVPRAPEPPLNDAPPLKKTEVTREDKWEMVALPDDSRKSEVVAVPEQRPPPKFVSVQERELASSKIQIEFCRYLVRKQGEALEAERRERAAAEQGMRRSLDAAELRYHHLSESQRAERREMLDGLVRSMADTLTRMRGSKHTNLLLSTRSRDDAGGGEGELYKYADDLQFAQGPGSPDARSAEINPDLTHYVQQQREALRQKSGRAVSPFESVGDLRKWWARQKELREQQQKQNEVLFEVRTKIAQVRGNNARSRSASRSRSPSISRAPSSASPRSASASPSVGQGLSKNPSQLLNAGVLLSGQPLDLSASPDAASTTSALKRDPLLDGEGAIASNSSSPLFPPSSAALLMASPPGMFAGAKVGPPFATPTIAANAVEQRGGNNSSCSTASATKEQDFLQNGNSVHVQSDRKELKPNGSMTSLGPTPTPVASPSPMRSAWVGASNGGPAHATAPAAPPAQAHDPLPEVGDEETIVFAGLSPPPFVTEEAAAGEQESESGEVFARARPGTTIVVEDMIDDDEVGEKKPAAGMKQFAEDIAAPGVDQDEDIEDETNAGAQEVVETTNIEAYDNDEFVATSENYNSEADEQELVDIPNIRGDNVPALRFYPEVREHFKKEKAAMEISALRNRKSPIMVAAPPGSAPEARSPRAQRAVTYASNESSVLTVSERTLSPPPAFVGNPEAVQQLRAQELEPPLVKKVGGGNRVAEEPGGFAGSASSSSSTSHLELMAAASHGVRVHSTRAGEGWGDNNGGLAANLPAATASGNATKKTVEGSSFGWTAEVSPIPRLHSARYAISAENETATSYWSPLRAAEQVDRQARSEAPRINLLDPEAEQQRNPLSPLRPRSSPSKSFSSPAITLQNLRQMLNQAKESVSSRGKTSVGRISGSGTSEGNLSLHVTNVRRLLFNHSPSPQLPAFAAFGAVGARPKTTSNPISTTVVPPPPPFLRRRSADQAKPQISVPLLDVLDGGRWKSPLASPTRTSVKTRVIPLAYNVGGPATRTRPDPDQITSASPSEEEAAARGASPLGGAVGSPAALELKARVQRLVKLVGAVSPRSLATRNRGLAARPSYDVPKMKRHEKHTSFGKGGNAFAFERRQQKGHASPLRDLRQRIATDSRSPSRQQLRRMIEVASSTDEEEFTVPKSTSSRGSGTSPKILGVHEGGTLRAFANMRRGVGQPDSNADQAPGSCQFGGASPLRRSLRELYRFDPGEAGAGPRQDGQTSSHVEARRLRLARKRLEHGLVRS